MRRELPAVPLLFNVGTAAPLVKANDADTGWYHNGFRDYMPNLGRYLQSDRIGLMGGLNTYAYAGGNPVNHIDSFGLQDLTYHYDWDLGAVSTRLTPETPRIKASGFEKSAPGDVALL